MNEPKPHKSMTRPMIRLENGGRAEDQADLIVEEPLSIRIDGRPYSVVMRTPGDETSHVAGFCLAEGLIDSPDDIATIGFCTEEGTNVATVTLAPERRAAVARLLARKGFVSQTSCGICGKEIVRDMQQILRPLPAKARFSGDQIAAALDLLSSSQELYKTSRGAHAAMIVDRQGRLLSFAEDVGRHNALDKAVGQVFLDRKLENGAMGLMSSRLSYELVQKAARAGLEVLVGFSRPTVLGVDLAMSVNMTLVCSQNNRLLVFSGQERII